MKRIQSTCNYCAIDCNLDFYVEDEKIVKVLPTAGYPVNDGFCCIKGLSLDRQQSVVRHSGLPKIRQKDGSFREVSWQEGLAHAAGKILEIQEKYGQEALAGISTGQLTLEEFAIFGHVMRNYLKANVDGNTRLCMATSVVAHKQSYGFDAPGFTLKDLELSDTLFFIGANPVIAHPIVWDRVKKNPDKKIIVIDPRRSETAQNADYWFGLRPKSDLVLFYALARLMIEKNHVDQEFVKNHTEGFEAFKAFVQEYTLEKAVAVTGLSEAEILQMAELIIRGKKVSFWWTMGVNQGYEAVRTAQAIINLALMTGNIGRPGTGPNSLTGQCNAMGSRVFSNTAGLFGGGDFNNPARRSAVCAALGVEDSVLAQKPTIPYNQIIEGIMEGRIKALWILCTNPRHSWTNNETFRRAVEKLELFIVQDIYENTESAEACSHLFPVVPGIKKEGTYINMERRISLMQPCLQRKAHEKSDYEVILEMGRALGMGDLLRGWERPESCFELMKKCSAGMPDDITGVTYDALRDSSGIQWPFRQGETLGSDERRLYEDGKFYRPGGKALFVFEEPLENPLPLQAPYTVILNTGRGTVGQWHTQTRTKEVEFIEDVSTRNAYIYINHLHAAEKGIHENDPVRVHSINGEQAVFSARLTDHVDYNQVYAPIHYIECNKLTPSVYDPYSKEPSYKSTPVWFEKAEEEM